MRFSLSFLTAFYLVNNYLEGNEMSIYTSWKWRLTNFVQELVILDHEKLDESLCTRRTETEIRLYRNLHKEYESFSSSSESSSFKPALK